MKTKLFSIMAAAALVSSLAGCKKPQPEPTPDPVPAPEITALNPTAGLGGDPVIITGKNFSAAAEENTVLFGEAKAQIIKATATQISVLAPEHIAGDVAVTVTCKEKKSNEVKFTYNEPVHPATVTGFTPVEAPIGADVVISGTEFGTDASVVHVYFGSVEANIKALQPTSITVTVPEGSGEVLLAVVVGDQDPISAGTFTYKFTREVVVTGVVPFIFTKDDEVTISGSGFSETLAENVVTIGGVSATVTGVTADALYVTVPALEKGDYTFTVSVVGAAAVETDPVTYYFVPEYTVSTVFGSGTASNVDGVGTEATLQLPEGLFMAPDGSMWVTTRGSTTAHTIRRCDLATGEVTTIIDAATVGTGKYPWGGAFDSKGVFYTCLKGVKKLAKVEKVDGAYTWTEFTLKNADGSDFDLEGSPMNILFDANDHMYVACRDGKKITVAYNGVVERVIGGFPTGPYHIGWGLNQESIFVFLNGGYKQYYIPTAATSADDAVHFLGTGTKPTAANFTTGTPGDPKTFTFGTCPGMVLDPADGYIYVNDLVCFTTNVIIPGPGRDYSKALVKIIAGTPFTQGKNNGDGLTEASFKAQGHLARDAQGNFYVADGIQNIIRKISVK